jgi:two-component system sensor histidine kinase DctS
MRRIAEQAERAGRVIKSVHDFVRRRDQAREAVAPQALLDADPAAGEPAGAQARRAGGDPVADGLPRVLCDRTMVEQVLLNLARNAMQAMDEARVPSPAAAAGARAGGTEAGKRWLEFSVADCGPASRRPSRTAVHALLHHQGRRAWGWA